MKKASIVIAQVIVGMLIGCMPEGAVILVLPYLYLWLAAVAVLHDLYQEHLRPTLGLDATIPISITVAGGPFFVGMAVCTDFR